MKKTFAIGLGVIIVLAGLLIINLTAAPATETNKQEQKKEKKGSCCSTEEGTGEMSDNSIYQLESKWTNQYNQPVELKDFEGKPVLLTMFFASCTYACPILVNDMKKIEAGLPQSELNNYQFVLVSIDPERDTPEKLKSFAIEKGIDLKRWKLLTGSSDNVMELAALLGFKYKKDSKGDYSHSNMVTLLNDDGEIVHQQVGLDQEASQTISEIKKL